MTEAFVIETDGATLGLAVRDGRRFRFISTEPTVQAIDRRLYPSLRALRQAAIAAFRAGLAGMSGRLRRPVW